VTRRAFGILAVLVVAYVLVSWSALFGPLARGGIVVLDVYSSALSGNNAAALITPEPRIEEQRITLAGQESRVTWWVPGWGDRHPAMLVVNGASTLGNDDPETRRISEALCRAGYLVMLPEFDFLKEARLERSATARVDAAFAAMLARRDADPERAGGFGFSVGGGILFAAAGTPGAALARARYLGALGAFFDIRTYLASVVTGTQVRQGRAEPWIPDPEARSKLPIGAAQAMSDPSDRDVVTAALRAGGGPIAADPPAVLGAEGRAVWLLLASPDYGTALARFDALPAALRDTFATLSPVTQWSAVTAPVYWLHDEGDRFEPVSEAERAFATVHAGTTELHLTRLLSHAAALGSDARQQGIDFWARELSGLLGFAYDVLKRAG
jgi:dienelactone hydrolase